MSVYDETVKAVDAARSSNLLENSDNGAVAALLHIAEQIDSQTGGLTPDGKLDNVSVPTYLKYADALGLTPLSRHRLLSIMKENADNEASTPQRDTGLGKFRSIAGGKAV